MHETQYYASTNCTRTLSEYGQSDYTIGANDVCNAVQSPKAPVEDDSVAWTEFVGLSYYLAPTAMPTVAPSAAPTVQPTPAPTPNNLVLFAAQQVKSSSFVVNVFDPLCF